MTSCTPRFFAATAAFIIVGSIAGLGTNVGLTYYVARYRALGEERKLPALMRTAIFPVIVASLATAAFVLVAAVPLAHLVLKGHAGQSGVTPDAVKNALRGLALALPFAGLLNAYLGASRGYGDMRPTAGKGLGRRQTGLARARDRFAQSCKSRQRELAVAGAGRESPSGRRVNRRGAGGFCIAASRSATSAADGRRSADLSSICSSRTSSGAGIWRFKLDGRAGLLDVIACNAAMDVLAGNG